MFGRQQRSRLARAIAGATMAALRFAWQPVPRAQAAGDRIDLPDLVATNGDSNLENIRLELAAARQAPSDAGVISAHTLGGSLSVSSSLSGKRLVPLTVPQNVSFRLSYAGERSGCIDVNASSGPILLL